MIPLTETFDHLAFDFDFTLDAIPTRGLFKVTIALREIAIHVEAVAGSVTEAMQMAADRCAQRLSQLGYESTSADVSAALERNLEPAIAPSSAIRQANN